MPATPIGERATTDAERQARYRAARASGAPVIRTRRPTDYRSRARRWNDTIAELMKLQTEYDAWRQNLPKKLQDTATAEALREISELDLGELQAIVPPRGFGRGRTADKPKQVASVGCVETGDESWRLAEPRLIRRPARPNEPGAVLAAVKHATRAGSAGGPWPCLTAAARDASR